LWTGIRSALAQASENVRHGRSLFVLTMGLRGAEANGDHDLAGNALADITIKQRDHTRAPRMTFSLASASAL
jgi:hypothetical protein